MPFTEENKPLLDAAAAIDFQLMKNGAINSNKHNAYERGLFFIKQAIENNGNKYGYSKVAYDNNNTNVTITCGHHGDFEKLPRSHISGQGCPACSNRKVPTTEEWVAKAKNVHKNRYDYTKSNYTGTKRPLEVTCPVHGTYQVRADHHLSGVGCAQCYYDSLRMSTEQFLIKAKDVHGDTYLYDLTDYTSAHTKVTITCIKHGPFDQEAAAHLRGQNCPKCSGHNHDILYLLKCHDTGWHKIGITTNTTGRRLYEIGGNIKEIHHVKLEDPRKHESILHKRYSKDREYNLCVKQGKTEFFSLTEYQVKEVIDYMNEVSNA